MKQIGGGDRVLDQPLLHAILQKVFEIQSIHREARGPQIASEPCALPIEFMARECHLGEAVVGSACSPIDMTSRQSRPYSRRKSSFASTDIVTWNTHTSTRFHERQFAKIESSTVREADGKIFRFDPPAKG